MKPQKMIQKTTKTTKTDANQFASDLANIDLNDLGSVSGGLTGAVVVDGGGGCTK